MKFTKDIRFPFIFISNETFQLKKVCEDSGRETIGEYRWVYENYSDNYAEDKPMGYGKDKYGNWMYARANFKLILERRHPPQAIHQMDKDELVHGYNQWFGEGEGNMEEICDAWVTKKLMMEHLECLINDLNSKGISLGDNRWLRSL